MSRCFIPALWVLLAFAASTARADLDAQVKTPYQLKVVLRIGANRVFTPLFQDQLQRELGNQLKISFGDLARIDVTRTHPLLSDIEAKGLDAALEGWDALSERTTHFVLLDYDAGMYRIQSRGHDGMTNQPFGATLRMKTAERTALSDTIAQQIEKSFSPVGTVTAVGKGGKDVTLTLKGGDLGVPMSRWVKPGRVFSVSRIVQQAGRTRAVRQEWALLEVLDPPSAGVCRCRYWHRYQEDALRQLPGTLGWRALRLATKASPVKVQLLDDTTLQPLDGKIVHISKPGSKDKAAELITNRDGIAQTRDNFPHLAIVQVLAEGVVRAQFPVETIAGRTVVARVKIQVDAESLAPLQTRRDAWLRRAYDDVLLSSERSAELSGLLNQSLESALDAARKRLTPLEEEIIYLDTEQDELARLAKERKTSFDLREGAQQIIELRSQAKTLDAFVKRLEGVLKDPDAEKSFGLTKLVERARLLESEADYAGAIRLYDQVVQASPEQTKIKAHLDSLRTAWQPKGEKHEAARAFIYKTWPALDVAGIEKEMANAKTAVAECKAVGDKLTLQKLLRVDVTHTVNLKKQLETLRRRDSEDNRNRTKALVQVSGALLSLHNDAAAFVGVRKE
ncbi:MAG TPA: hypothetical protein VFE62_03245 [Gemmataceae bacterium]|nr:hypothetical protein [Gemmataceae bacterium]